MPSPDFQVHSERIPSTKNPKMFFLKLIKIIRNIFFLKKYIFIKVMELKRNLSTNL